MFDIFFTQLTLMIFVTAIVFTIVGWIWGKRSSIEDVVAATIDSLIDDGYLKTRGVGREMEILKWQEWETTRSDE